MLSAEDTHPVHKSNFCNVRYLKKAQCIIEQYGNYSIANLDNLPVSGVNTQVQDSP
jgi:hypothetical protein